MGRDRDHYREGQRDAREGKGYSPPHEGGLERIIKTPEEVADKDDYREGYRDEKSGR